MKGLSFLAVFILLLGVVLYATGIRGRGPALIEALKK